MASPAILARLKDIAAGKPVAAEDIDTLTGLFREAHRGLAIVPAFASKQGTSG